MSIADQLKQSPLFKSVEPEALEALVKVMTPKSFPANTVVFEKGDPGDTMYIITAGRLRIYTHDEMGNLITLTYFEPVRVFGDFALLDQQARSASAAAVEPLEVLALTREMFFQFVREYPSLGLAMLRNLVERVRYITNYLNKVNDAITVLSSWDYERAIQELAVSSTDDSDIKGLIGAFVQMVHSIREREAKLMADAELPPTDEDE